MKANEAPEKLYLQFNSIVEAGKRKLTLYKVSNDDIKYIRADAFIEKACEWLKESITNNSECNKIISKKGVITMGLLIEDFKKYMED